MATFKELPEIFYLGFYHPRSNHFEDYCDENVYFNEYFNKYSATILDLKNGDSEAIHFFIQELCNLMSDEDISVTTVPPSSSSSSGIRNLAQHLVKSKKDFVDATLCLERFKNVDKLSSSSSISKRSLDIHLNSIRVNYRELIKGKKVILLDDVLTTGNSIKACLTLLLEAGAKEVKTIVLGKTIRNVEEAHDLIDRERDEYLESIDNDTYSELNQVGKDTSIELLLLVEEIKAEHEEVDEWASEEHDKLDPDDEEHYYVDRKAEEKHEEVDEFDRESTDQIYQE